MNESEIIKLVNSMTKKFLNGGLIDCLRAGGNLTECKKCGGVVKEEQNRGITEAQQKNNYIINARKGLSRKNSKKIALEEGKSRKEWRAEYREAKENIKNNRLGNHEQPMIVQRPALKTISPSEQMFAFQPIVLEKPETLSSRKEDDYALAKRQEAKALADIESAKTFREAFRIARAAGFPVFSWKGKNYTTELRGYSFNDALSKHEKMLKDKKMPSVHIDDYIQDVVEEPVER
jgi:hypothetical protein